MTFRGINLTALVIALCLTSFGGLLGAVAYTRVEALASQNAASLCALRHHAEIESKLYWGQMKAAPLGSAHRAFYLREFHEATELARALKSIKCK